MYLKVSILVVMIVAVSACVQTSRPAEPAAVAISIATTPPTNTPTPIATVTSSPSTTPSPTEIPSPTASPTTVISATSVPILIPTAIPTNTAVNTATATLTIIPVSTPTLTITPIATPLLTATPIPTATSVPTATATPTPDIVSAISTSKGGVVRIDTTTGGGSGFIYDASGWILTNAHVVGDSKQVDIFVDGTLELTGEVIARNQLVDLAVVKIETEHELTSLELGSPDTVLGQEVVALGFPPVQIGIEFTATRGFISAMSELEGINYIQVDATLNPGNSGGPLINSSGEVLGIVTRRLEANPSMGLAIATDSIEIYISALENGQSTYFPIKELASSRTFDHPRGIWEIDYPENWRVSGPNEIPTLSNYYDIFVTTFTAPYDAPFTRMAIFRFRNQGERFTISEWNERIKDENQDRFEEYSQISESKHGKRSFLLTSSFQDDDGTIFYLLQLNGETAQEDDFSVELIASEEAWETFEEDFRDLVLSVISTRQTTL